MRCGVPRSDSSDTAVKRRLLFKTNEPEDSVRPGRSPKPPRYWALPMHLNLKRSIHRLPSCREKLERPAPAVKVLGTGRAEPESGSRACIFEPSCAAETNGHSRFPVVDTSASGGANFRSRLCQVKHVTSPYITQVQWFWIQYM